MESFHASTELRKDECECVRDEMNASKEPLVNTKLRRRQRTKLEQA